MEEDIKILEDFLYYANCEECKGVSTCDDCIIERTQVKAIENLINRVKELEEFKKQVTEIENTNFIKYKNYISKSKIREKIEELENIFDMKEEWYTKQYIIEVLQEILEDK